MTSPPDNQALLDALTALRAERDLASSWRTIDKWMRHRFPSSKDDDVRQAALLAIHRGVATLDATDPGRCASWVRTIVERKRIDRHRQERRSRQAVALVGSDGANLDVEGDAAVVLSESLASELFFEVEASLDAHLETHHARPLDRIMPRLYARARLLRSMGHSLIEIRETLEVQATDAALSKWIERGLGPLVAAIRRWRDAAPEDRSGLAERLLERVEARRGDAGKVRIQRRKSLSDGKSSVGSRGRRPSQRRPCCMPARFHQPRHRSHLRAPLASGDARRGRAKGRR